MGYKPLNMFTAKTDELKKLIREHPDYPIVVVCNSDVVADENGWWYAPEISFKTGVILDCEQDINDEKVYIDEDDFEEDIRYTMEDREDLEDVSDEEFDRAVEEEMKKYEPYWKKVIAIYADV